MKLVGVFSGTAAPGPLARRWNRSDGPIFPSCGRKPTASEEDVGEREESEQLRAVLLDAAVAHLAIAELAFDDAEDVLDLGAHLAETAIASTLTLCEFTARFAFSFTAQSTPASSAARFFSSLA